VGSEHEVNAMLLRLLDFLKSEQITAFFTALTAGGSALEKTDVAISSLIDTWILLRDIESSGERNRGLYVLKARGTAHSNQIREFLITSRGVQLRDVYTGPEGVLTGSARASRESEERVEETTRQQSIERMRRDLAAKRLAVDAQIEALKAQFTAEQNDLTLRIDQETSRLREIASDRKSMLTRRGGEGPSNEPGGNGLP